MPDLPGGRDVPRAWVTRGRPEKAAFVVVHGLGDKLESYLEHARRLHGRAHRLWVVPGADHVGGIWHPDWSKVVLGFLDESGV